MIEQLEVLRLVVGRLEGAGIAYMVTGSIALSYYATPRMTRDIDFVVEVGPDGADSLAAAFREGFYCDEEAAQLAVAERGMVNIIHQESALKIDLIVRKATVYHQQEFSRRQLGDIDGLAVWLASPEDVLLSKLLWSKAGESDLQLRDAANLVRSVEKLDWAYVNRWAAELSVAERLLQVRRDEP